MAEIGRRFAGEDVTVVEGDFTKEIPFEGQFDIIFDRGAMTCNTSADIRAGIMLAEKKLKPGGYYFGVDWLSTKHYAYTEGSQEYNVVDDYTRKFRTGCFSGMGNIHFSDEAYIRDLFCDFELKQLYEKVSIWEIPEKRCEAGFNFAAKYGQENK